jgi:hypothetical protein
LCSPKIERESGVSEHHRFANVVGERAEAEAMMSIEIEGL